MRRALGLLAASAIASAALVACSPPHEKDSETSWSDVEHSRPSGAAVESSSSESATESTDMMGTESATESTSETSATTEPAAAH